MLNELKSSNEALMRGAYVTAVRWHEKLCNLAPMHAERVEAGTRDDVPQYDIEVYASRHQVAGVVTRAVIAWIQQAGHLTRVTFELLVRK